MEGIWDINKIQEILPQRYPFLFIDRVISIDEKEGKVTCLKNFTANDYFFTGHFPGKPVVPGVIIIEAMAQASIIGFAAIKPEIASKHPTYYLGKVEAKFRKAVTVGDQLIIEVKKEKIVNNAGVVTAVAKLNGEVAAEAKIMFGVIPNNQASDNK
ncbi:MAG: 3-hydroxyacyl-ACP dehydratase FabZ [Candidatus Omnitrophica bacterium]|jgi:3-hydroxyacyl-[acyl-carrier-protein] dehydratase|nr:3-hydroxyacyl-ACP dehydratase FabZ [Candidatus Omnitrophota bacterium]